MLYGASRMQQNCSPLLRPGPRWGSLQRSPDPVACGEDITPDLGPSHLASDPLSPIYGAD